MNDGGVGSVRIVFNLRFFVMVGSVCTQFWCKLSKTSPPFRECGPEKGRRKDLVYMFISLVACSTF